MKKIGVLLLTLLVVAIFGSCSKDDDVSVTGISLSPKTLTLLKGESQKLNVTITPQNATDTTVTWKTSDPSIATVSTSGVVTAVGAGSATITVTSTDGQFSASCNVTVNVNVASITLSETSLRIEKGDSKTLRATISPDDATNRTIVWSSSNEKVASVDQNGKITALAGGSATITATSADGKAKAQCEVNVFVSVNGISLNQSTLTLIRGQKETLVPTITPSDATTTDIDWSSSNNQLATVNKGVVTALKAGKVTITATTVDGKKTASCEITIKPSEVIDYNPFGDGQNW